ncbi:MAG: thioesterase family protein [Planctomycetota bacterium]|jgi:predicted thioesterase
MKKSLRAGVSGDVQHRVVTENLVSFRNSGAPPVLATPWLLQWMETAAYEAIRPHLDPGEASVGVGFDFEHLAPTPAGDTVVATAQVTAIDGKRISLDIEARDSHERIARGKHVRAVVDLERFGDRLRKKQAGY